MIGEHPAASEATTDDLPFFGLDGSTGRYLLDAAPDELARLALSEQVGSAHVDDIKARLDRAKPGLGVVDAVDDITDLAQTGWAVIFPAEVSPAIREALRELLDLRRAQATRRRGEYYQEYLYYPGETKQAFLRRLHVPPSGAADPDRMPYYLLLVGGPESIPFAFQYQLDVQYAVGRLAFDSVEEYAQYAHSVVTAESSGPQKRSATFFGVQNPDDTATGLSATRLVAPLAKQLEAAQAAQPEAERWRIINIGAGETSKARLRRVLGGDDTPALLFTASHGLAFPCGDARQRASQGALVCQDWPGPAQWQGELPSDFYFAAEDVTDDARLLGLIAFHFACFGAGTPQLEDYPQLGQGALADLGSLGTRLSRSIAPRAFVARLPQRLLGHPRGGALAVVGHVERALGSSFVWDRTGRRESSVRPFEDVMRRLMRGTPVGAALEPLNQRYAELCADLADELREVEQSGKVPDPKELARLWTGSADARGYVIFGDPAVRLGVVHNPGYRQTEVSTVQVHTAATAAEAVPVARPPDALTRDSTVRIDVDPQTGHITITSSRPAPTGSASEGSVDDVSYGLLGGLGGAPLADLRASISEGLKTAAGQLTEAVAHLMNEVSTLEVATYSSEDLSNVDFDAASGRVVGPVRRRALTRMRLDGQTLAIVPEENGKVDEQFWSVHCQIVEQAQAQRAELLKSSLAAVSNLLGALKSL